MRQRTPVSLVFATVLASLCVIAALAAARPVPLERPPDVARHPSSPAALENASVGESASACGSFQGAVAELWKAHVARAAPVANPDAANYDSGEIAVIEDDGTLFFNDKDGHRLLDVFAAVHAFSRTHGDDYDQLAFYLAGGQTTWLGSPGALAAAFVVRNDVQGIGTPLYDLSGSCGAPSRLQSALVMNGLHLYFDDPDFSNVPDEFTPMDLLAHEFGHRWLAYVRVDSAGEPTPSLLGRARQHWNLFADVDGSVMEGASWARVGLDSFYTDSVTVGYGQLDQYLMGLRSKFETPPLFVVNDETDFNPQGVYVNHSDPFVGLGCDGRASEWSVDDIEAVEGPRVPDAVTSPKNFRLGFVLIVPPSSAPSPAELAKIEAFRARFAGYFGEATWYRGTLDATLDSRFGAVAITHTPLPDLENAFAARNVGVRARVGGGGLPSSVTADSVTLFWRPEGAPGWNETPFSAVAGDSFAATFPAPGANGVFEYFIRAAATPAGDAGFDPPAGASSPHTLAVGPDALLPSIGHSPVHVQGQAAMPQKLIARVTDNTDVDSVWVEYSLNGGPLQSSPAAVAGRDSFSATLGSGLVQGQSLAYRFAARDGASSPNTSYSSAAIETLRVARNRTHDFENGADGFLHSAYWFSYRDAWALSASDAAPPGGSAWKCGAADSCEYPPHLDANLYMPLLSDVVPGTTLRFEHRFELESYDDDLAWDGARVEVSVNNGPWLVAPAAGGYSHAFLMNSNPFQAGTPCWSGSSQGWRSESIDLGAYAPGPLRVRFRMLADDFYGLDGWTVDRVRVQYPGDLVDVEGPAVRPFAISPPWPNPARESLRLEATIARHVADARWSLFDVQGRHVATLWRGALDPGERVLEGRLARTLGPGLYFSRLTLDGVEAARARVAISR